MVTRSRTHLQELKDIQRKEKKEETPVGQYPLRLVSQLIPDTPGPNGEIRYRAEGVYQHIPFTSSDLLSWKTSRTSWSEDPTGMSSLIEGILGTHFPSWLDIQQLLTVLLKPRGKEFGFKSGTRRSSSRIHWS